MEHDFDSELEQLMEEIKDNLTGEYWEDIRSVLAFEQDTIEKINDELRKSIDELESETISDLQVMLELAHPETTAQFWRNLYSYRSNIQARDEAVEELRQIASNSRFWLRPYVTGFLTGLGNQMDRLE